MTTTVNPELLDQFAAFMAAQQQESKPLPLKEYLAARFKDFKDDARDLAQRLDEQFYITTADEHGEAHSIEFDMTIRYERAINFITQSKWGIFRARAWVEGQEMRLRENKDIQLTTKNSTWGNGDISAMEKEIQRSWQQVEQQELLFFAGIVWKENLETEALRIHRASAPEEGDMYSEGGRFDEPTVYDRICRIAEFSKPDMDISDKAYQDYMDKRDSRRVQARREQARAATGASYLLNQNGRSFGGPSK